VSKNASVYASSNSYYPYQVTTSGSTGETVTQTTRRTADFTVSASGTLTGITKALKYMNDNHLNDYVIESYSQLNGNATGGYINEYGLYTIAGKDMAMPTTLYRLKNGSSISNYTPLSLSISSNTATLNKDSRYEQEASYNNFNAQGNPGRLVDKSGESSLLWGYDGKYMVARLDHIDYNALQTYLSNNPSVQQTLDNPATAAALLNAIQQLRTAFPQAMISGYAYLPGIGISTISDANNQISTYEYDNLGRLLRIKDANGNLIRTNEYQYQN
jgi:YD repeat-containing protein